MSKLPFLARLSLLALAVACQDPMAAVDPVWGKQACASCTMLVSDRRYAAQVVTRDGTHVFFDDPGCMATWLAQGHAGEKLWVHAPGGAWVDARAARYATGQPSPMGFGFAPDEHGAARWADVESAARHREEGAHD